MKFSYVIRDDRDSTVLATIHPASPDAVLTVMSGDTESGDGRSEPVWVRLPNGDLILGVFPQGETYFAVEEDAQWPQPDPEPEQITVTLGKGVAKDFLWSGTRREEVEAAIREALS